MLVFFFCILFWAGDWEEDVGKDVNGGGEKGRVGGERKAGVFYRRGNAQTTSQRGVSGEGEEFSKGVERVIGPEGGQIGLRARELSRVRLETEKRGFHRLPLRDLRRDRRGSRSLLLGCSHRLNL